MQTPSGQASEFSVWSHTHPFSDVFLWRNLWINWFLWLFRLGLRVDKVTTGKTVENGGFSDFPVKTNHTLTWEAAGNWERFTSRHQPTACGTHRRKYVTQPLPAQLCVCVCVCLCVSMWSQLPAVAHLKQSSHLLPINSSSARVSAPLIRLTGHSLLLCMGQVLQPGFSRIL